MNQKKNAIGPLIIALFFISGCATQNRAPNIQIAATSNELAAGQMLHKKILSDFKPLQNPEITAYVQKITTQLAKHARRKLNYQTTVLQDERIYAISAPGGNVYITTGFLKFLRSEAELASVIGHEIGQLQFLATRFDPIKKAVTTVARTGQMIGPLFGQIGALASLGLVAIQATYAHDPHIDIRIQESDKWAMQTLLSENYDPQALLNTLEHFAKYDRQGLTLFYDYYQSRPITVPRLKAAHQEFEKLNLAGLELQTNYKNYQQKIKSLTD